MLRRSTLRPDHPCPPTRPAAVPSCAHPTPRCRRPDWPRRRLSIGTTTAGQPSLLRREHRGQHTLDRTHPPVQSQLAEQHRLLQPRPRLLPVRRQHRDANAMSYTEPIFGNVAGDKRQRQPRHRPGEAAIGDRGRTRSRDSCNAASANPTRCTPGRPEVISASISTISPSSPRTATEKARPAPSPHPLHVGDLRGAARPIRTHDIDAHPRPTAALPASHNPANRRSRRTFVRSHRLLHPPNWSLVRVFTSTNTTARAASSAAMTSSSP